MVKVRQIVGGIQNAGLSGGSIPEGDLTAGARSVPWFRGFYTVPLSFFVVQVISALGFLGAAIQNFVDVHTETSSASQNTMSIIFLVLSIWFVIGWPLVVQSLA